MDLSQYIDNMDRRKVKKLIPKLQPDEINTFLWKESTVIHRHSDWEFTATTDGTGVNLVNGEAFYSTPGVFLLLGPNHVHKQTSDLPIRRRDVCVSLELMEELTGLLSPDLYSQLSEQTKPIKIKLSMESFNELHDRLNKAECLDVKESRIAVLKSIVMYLLGVYVENTSEKFVPKDILTFLQKLQDPTVFFNEGERHHRTQFLFPFALYKTLQKIRRKDHHRVRRRPEAFIRRETAFDNRHVGNHRIVERRLRQLVLFRAEIQKQIQGLARGIQKFFPSGKLILPFIRSISLSGFMSPRKPSFGFAAFFFILLPILYYCRFFLPKVLYSHLCPRGILRRRPRRLLPVRRFLPSSSGRKFCRPLPSFRLLQT